MTIRTSASAPIEAQATADEREVVWQPVPADYNVRVLAGWQRRWVETRAAWHILILALQAYRDIRRSVKVMKALYSFKKNILGGIETKIVKIENKYYHSIYAPAFPSDIFDRYILSEFNRIAPLNSGVNRLSFIFFAITSKCPLRCEHCFEWNKLNKPESFSPAQLKAVVSKFQNGGISQFHLSGGEPMVRIKDIVPLIETGRENSEFYVLTSGFNFTATNARTLKEAGLTGVVISLDHYDPEMHDAFRGFHNSFTDVLKAVNYAQEQNLLVAFSLCATKEFTTKEKLMQYLELAKRMKVPFVQILEPKAVGHYEGRDVSLNQSHFDILDQFYQLVNFDPAYRDSPVIIYHGYHLRRKGCLSGGNRSLYIDSEGAINACPFCHTNAVNVKDLLLTDSEIPDDILALGCSRYRSV